MKLNSNPAAVSAPAADTTAGESSLDATRVVASQVPSFASTIRSTAAARVATIPAAAMSPRPPVSMATPTADPVSRFVSTLINAVVSPFANSAPSAPAQSPAMWTLLASARREFEPGFSNPSMTANPLPGQVTNGLVTDAVGTAAVNPNPADPDFIVSTMNFFGLFSITSAGDPSDNNFVAVVFQTPFFTNILTSGADPEGNLGFGAAGIGVAGQTVNTFISPFGTFSVAIPVEDPFAELFIALIQAGII